MTARRLAFLLAALLLPGSALAQEQPRRDPEVLAMLQQSFLAMGRANLDAIRDTRATVQGTTLRHGERATFTATFTTLGLRTLRIDAHTPDGPSIVVVREGNVLSRRRGEEVQQVPRMTVANGGITHIPLLSVLAEWVESKVAVEYLGLETADGSAVHHIRLKRPWPGAEGPGEEPPPCEIYLDAKTLVPLQLVYPMHSPSNIRISEPVTITYGDYRIVSGLAIPHAVSQSIRGQVVSEFRVTSFAVNQGIALSEFELR